MEQTRDSGDNLLNQDMQPSENLRIQGLSIYTAQVEVGHPREVTISFRVTNIGKDAITKPFRTSLFPGNIKFDRLRPLLDTHYVNTAELAAGQAIYISRTTVLPSSVNEFDVRIEVDVDHAITGVDRTNNIVISPFKNPTPDVGRWVSIGPTRISSTPDAVGRLSAIAIHPTAPSTIYVGASGSGVWKTNDGGAPWRPVTNSLPTLAIAAIAVDPSAPLRVYVATPGFGVFRSEDAGTSWTQISSDLQAEARWGVFLVHPTNPNVLYLTSAVGVYRSGDFGATWQLSKSGGRATDLVMNPSNPNILYAAISRDGIYKTTDGGTGGNSDWVRLSAGLPSTDIQHITLALCSGNPGVVYAGYARSTGFQLYRTTDGTSWSLRSSPTFPLFNDVIGVDPVDPNTVYITGKDFYRSTDGGTNFVPKGGTHVDHHAFATDPVTAGVIYALNDGGIYRSANRGDAWTFIGEGIANVEFYDIAHAVTQPSLVIGGVQDNGNIKYDGSSTVWKEMLEGDGATVDIDPTNAQILYAMGQYASSIQRSTNGGESWTNIASGLPTGTTCFQLHFQVHPTMSKTLLASCRSLWRTTLPGSSWSPLFRPPSGSILRSAVDPTVNLYYAGSSDGRLYAGSAGSNWQTVFTHPASSSVTDIEIDLDDPATVYITFSGTNTGRVYRLRRASPAPTTMTALDITFNLTTGLSARTVAVDRIVPLTIYVGTNQGVYRGRSPDGGATWSWTSYTNGLPLADVVDLEVHPITGVLRAATFGRSAYEVNTAGWHPNVQIPNQQSKATPVLAVFNDQLHMVHLGDSSTNLWHSIYDGGAWHPNVQIPNQQSKATPVLAVFNDQLHMVHLGDSSNNLWSSIYDGGAWHPNVQIPNQQSKATPVLAVFNDQLHMVHLGDSSNNLWQ